MFPWSDAATISLKIIYNQYKAQDNKKYTDPATDCGSHSQGDLSYWLSLFVDVIKAAVNVCSIRRDLECLCEGHMAKWGALATKTIRISI